MAGACGRGTARTVRISTRWADVWMMRPESAPPEVQETAKGGATGLGVSAWPNIRATFWGNRPHSAMPAKRRSVASRKAASPPPPTPVDAEVIEEPAAVEAALVVPPQVAKGTGSRKSVAPVAAAPPKRPLSPPSLSDDAGDSSDSGSSSDEAPSRAAARGGAAWSDSDDEDVRVNIAAKSRLRKLRKTEEDSVLVGKEYADRLRKRFAETYGSPEWAKVDETDGTDVAVATTAPLVGASAVLPRDLLDISRQRDANHEEPSKAVVQALQFHPSGQLILTAGYDQKLRLFQVGHFASYCALCVSVWVSACACVWMCVRACV